MRLVMFSREVVHELPMSPEKESFEQAMLFSEEAHLAELETINEFLHAIAECCMEKFTALFFENLSFARPCTIIRQLEKLVDEHGSKSVFGSLLNQIAESKDSDFWYDRSELKLGFSTRCKRLTIVFGALGIKQWRVDTIVSDELLVIDTCIVRRPTMHL
jgi:hypothetical protein